MLELDDLAETSSAFGVAEDQVRRDHLISHILVALVELKAPVVFFGGTALARTHLADPFDGARLSEDIDLHTGQRQAVAQLLEAKLPRALRREFPGAEWDVPLSSVRDKDSAIFAVEGMALRIQLLDTNRYPDYERYPTELREVALRYHDLTESVPMRTPTRAGFAGMKTAAWDDRHAERDLYDLAGLARIGALDTESAELFEHATGRTVQPHMFSRLPNHGFDWDGQLSHQCSSPPPALACLNQVRAAYGGALGWEQRAYS
jgi:predicted nucleotidyltransferase component of viral defense system